MISKQNAESPLYAIIDLGSNSFHMLIARLLADSVQTVDKVKRKVRLAGGLDEDNNLDEAAISRGLECLSFFAERLQDIPAENIRVVATATLRIANNAGLFLTRAEKILGTKVSLLTGLEEAETIYLGVAHTSCSADQRLVLDIGGASTEIIIGEAFAVKKITSLDIGCVTFNRRYFADGLLSEKNFTAAITRAKAELAPLVASYTDIGWQDVLGGSGTMQALAEILMYQKRPAIITLDFLHALQQQLLACKRVADITIPGLAIDRKPVFASGLAILTALFETLNIRQLQLSSGALREGLLYEMLPDMRKISIRQRTINSLTQRFHIDQPHASRVNEQAGRLIQLWQLPQAKPHTNQVQLLTTACALHEVGLLMEYKHHQQHGAYIIQHADLPGFDQSERQLLVALVRLYKADINLEQLKDQATVPYRDACLLLAALRLAVILCRRRRDDVLPDYQSRIEGQTIYLCLPQQWLAQHPLIVDELRQENLYLRTLDLSLSIEC
ncbi:guanosine-5'-triphosphate,3'-diphosphate pyrophosphatase [Thalassomonas viridans]|uniref:Guanosine-5'-triphosphate,3'-diphosphate pyrophosphatase n=2 Tax=Thalassomonas viridans TaxID=137584 RepID=A0AAF0CCG3_9GAMM|nr:guanosine-5'-triphosphate,3'-diphosphate pyrophosphatase [Thalassomonas viridans]